LVDDRAMNQNPASQPQDKRPVGGELIIPVAGLVFTGYYFTTIIDSPWTAQVSAFFVGTILVALSLLFVVKASGMVRRGEADFGVSGVFNATDRETGRHWLLALTVAYILLVEWGGFTITTFVFLLAAMLVLNKGRRPLFITLLSAALAFGGYALFIFAFEVRFPVGPFERLIRWLLA
jgi:hypothetical protein